MSAIMEIDEKEFAVPFFLENGFSRRQCENCKSHYWSQDSASKFCGDIPCVDYSFIDRPPTRARLSFPEMRKLFLSFFEKNGHTTIRPYPVVARWRDDVYLVGASIYNFQPYVTEGVVPPPANPLVVSQPCLRFTDIDSVGPTAGRHLLIFEMGGHHAFNYPDKEVYWKDETLRLHHQLLTDELGVKSELVSYKEHFWSGGGNAGPDVEACVNGLEISTLVFMEFKLVDGTLAKLPIRTVDTGYGIERWTWLSQGSPSCFHTIHKHLFDEIVKGTSLKIDERILAETARLAGRIDVTKPSWRRNLSRQISEKLQGDQKAIEKALITAEQIYAVADHTKALVFLLSEGVVPSNIGVGYLARLLIRRTVRTLRILKLEEKLDRLVEMQIAHWSEDYPHLREMSNEIFGILHVEQAKYDKTLERGVEMVRRVVSEGKTRGQRKIPVETLVELYDSHGLVPDLAKEIASGEQVEVDIPWNFYSMVAARHSAPTSVKEPKQLEALSNRIGALPATVQLYYKDPFTREFDASVQGSVDDRFLVLDQTCFYPEGGGQLPDHGEIIFGDKSCKVVDVQKVGNVILHEAEGTLPRIGEAVRGRVDWERRISLMRHHTATHILLGASRRTLGEHVWQAGAQKDVERSRIDISHYSHLTEEQLEQIEKLAAETVLRNITVETDWLPRNKAEQIYGFRLYQGGVVPGGEVRVVKIGDWDVEACGGTHCARTGQVGLIKILRAERIQDGVERLIFTAGLQALKAIQQREHILNRTATILESPAEQTEQKVASLLEERGKLAKEVKDLTERLAGREAQELAAKAVKVGRVKFVAAKRTADSEAAGLAIINMMAKNDPSIVVCLALIGDRVKLMVGAGEKAMKKGVHAGNLASDLGKLIGGGGGGKPYFGQAGGADLQAVDRAFRTARRILLKQIRTR